MLKIISSTCLVRTILRIAVLPLLALSCASHAATLSITASPVSVPSGTPSTLTWTSTDASNCAASGAWSGVKAASGNQRVIAPNGLNSYLLNCSGPSGSASNSAVIGAGTPAPAVYALNVTLSGSGAVTSNPSGITCGVTCNASYPSGAAVTLSATPAAGYTFTGWSGACSGSGACVGAMTANRTITATFTNSTTQILFEENFNNPGPNLTYSFDYAKFGDSNRPWDREHLPTGGVNGGSAFRTISTFDSINPDGGTSYFFTKEFTGALATHSRDFWVRQCMKYSEGFIDARIMRPINPKINYFIATNGGILSYTATSGAFLARERVTGQSSGARADFFQPGVSSGRVTNIVGTFQAGEVLVGQVSGARGVFASYDPQWRNMQLNHFWHPGDPGDGSRGGGYQDLRWQDQTNGYYFPANNPLNLVRHTNFLVLQEHYNEWMCLETYIDMDQVPWLAEVYVTTAPGAATLAPGTSALDGNGRRQFNDYLYIRFSNPVAPALEPGFGINWNEYGSYGGALPGDQVYFDEMVITTGKVGHPFR